MSASLVALIIFLVLYAIIAGCVYSKRKQEYDERQKCMQSIAYKYGFYALILATLGNAFINWYIKSDWGTPLTEAFVIICIGCIIFFAVCVFKDAYFSYSETPKKNIIQSVILFTLIGGLNVYTGIMNQREIIVQHIHGKFDNINLISGIMILLCDVLIIIRAIMDFQQQKAED